MAVWTNVESSILLVGSIGVLIFVVVISLFGCVLDISKLVAMSVSGKVALYIYIYIHVVHRFSKW